MCVAVLCACNRTNFYYQPGARELAGPKIALHFPRLSVCLFVRPHLSGAQYYVMRYYATAVYYCTNRFWRLAGQDTASKYRFVLPIRRKSGRQAIIIVFATYSC